MNLKKLLLTLALQLSFLSPVSSEMFEISHMDELNKFIKPDSLIIFDIDNTLVMPAQDLGTDEWFYHQFESYLRSGMLINDALEKALFEWNAIQLLTKVCIVEPGTQKIIKHLQNEGFKAMALTTRGLEISACTVKQLKSLNIDLNLTSPSRSNHYFMVDQSQVLFHEAILFTAGAHKGICLFKFLDTIQYVPSSIVFINDKASHIEQIEKTAIEKNIPFIGLRYGFLDKKVKNFNQEIANIQFEKFGQLLTNQEAYHLLNCNTVE